MRQLACGFLLQFVLCLCTRSAGAGNAPSSVKDLQYGEALFHYFQQDYFGSIVCLQIAQQQGRLPNHAAEAELLLGGLELSYGLRDSATRIFRRLLAADSEPSVRNRAWYYLAKAAYQRGASDQALEAIGFIDAEMSPATHVETANLHSLLLLQQGRNADAIGVLQDARSRKHWSPYLAYNLGVALLRDNRPVEGARALEKIGDSDADNEELRLLRDKANLALGFSLLQSGYAEQSRAHLERVRLDGPLSGRALLGAGWADADNGEYQRALTPWGELGGRDTTDPAVQEVLLAIPYALTKLQLHGRAVQQYNAGIATLMNERQRLDLSIRAIQHGELEELLAQQADGTDSGWLERLGRHADSVIARDLLALLAGHGFHEAAKDYRDLVFLQDNLEDWAASMTAFDDLLSLRRTRYEKQRPAAQRALEDDTLQNLQRRHAAISTALAGIESSGDPVGLADAEEARHWRSLTAMGKRIDKLAVTPQTLVLREKQQRLRGILYWRLASDDRARLWEAKQQLADLDKRMQRAREGLAALRHADLDTPADFSLFGRRIAAQKAAIAGLLARTGRVRQAQGALLQRLAVKELERQCKRLDVYLMQARFALAQTYDSALTVAPAGGATP